MLKDRVYSPSLFPSFVGFASFSEIIFFIPKSFYFSLPIELYLPFDLSESKWFLKVFFLFDVYKAVLNNIPQEFFFANDPGVEFLEVSFMGLIDDSSLQDGSLIFCLPVFNFLSFIIFWYKMDPPSKL